MKKQFLTFFLVFGCICSFSYNMSASGGVGKAGFRDEVGEDGLSTALNVGESLAKRVFSCVWDKVWNSEPAQITRRVGIPMTLCCSVSWFFGGNRKTTALSSSVGGLSGGLYHVIRRSRKNQDELKRALSEAKRDREEKYRETQEAIQRNFAALQEAQAALKAAQEENQRLFGVAEQSRSQIASKRDELLRAACSDRERIAQEARADRASMQEQIEGLTDAVSGFGEQIEGLVQKAELITAAMKAGFEKQGIEVAGLFKDMQEALMGDFSDLKKGQSDLGCLMMAVRDGQSGLERAQEILSRIQKRERSSESRLSSLSKTMSLRLRNLSTDSIASELRRSLHGDPESPGSDHMLSDS